jgi:hypothetical protein
MSTAETEHGGNPTVDDVLDALAPLMDRLDHYRGFSVRHPRDTATNGRILDPSVVEVRVTPGADRHPVEADHAAAMLRDAGFSVEREVRGGQSSVQYVVSVRTSEREDSEDVGPTPTGGEEQTTF